MPTIKQAYRRDQLFPILAPLDGRKGQLVPGQLATTGSAIDLSFLANVIDLKVGDSLFFVSSAAELSGNLLAEAVAANTEEFVVDDIAASVVTLDHAWTAEPNIEAKFFEYKVLRRIPQDSFTFPRVDQLDFSLGAAFLYVNGVEEVATWSNPSGEQTLLAFTGGTILFAPLGSGRYRVELRITIDANVEVVIPDAIEAIDLRLTNLGVAEDLPLWSVGNNGADFFAWMKGRMRTLEQMIGLSFIDGQRGVDVRIVTSKPSRQQAQAGSTTEILVNLTTGLKEDPFDLNGAVVYFESRCLIQATAGPFIQAEIVSPGLVRVLIPGADLKAGVLACQMVIYAADVPADVLRTNTFTLTVLS